MTSDMPEAAKDGGVMEMLQRACMPKAMFGRDEDELGQCAFIPLTLLDRADGLPLLSVSGKGTLVGFENRSAVPAGVYAVHIFDTAGEARAAVSVMSSFAGGFAAEAGVLPGGEGLALLRSNALRAADVAFEGAGGMVSLTIVNDRRRNHSNRPPACSMDWSRQVGLHYIGGGLLVDIDCYARAKSLADIIGEATPNSTCLSMTQDFIEHFPGARVTLQGVSAEQVIESAEDILADLCEGVELPTIRVMHSMIRKAAARTDSSPSDEVSYKLAHDIITQNRF